MPNRITNAVISEAFGQVSIGKLATTLYEYQKTMAPGLSITQDEFFLRYSDIRMELKEWLTLERVRKASHEEQGLCSALTTIFRSTWR